MLDRLINTGIERWVEKTRGELNLPVQLHLWTGDTFDLGRFEKPLVRIHIRDAATLPLLLEPNLDTLGDAYVKEKIDVDGALADIISIAYQLSESHIQAPKFVKAAKKILHTRKKDKEAIQYHYDVSNEFYQIWLDERMIYSCAYFETGDETLDVAQVKKLDHILRKIRLRPGQTLLDIGCGWGALVIRAAQQFGARCVGVTLSEKQYQLATARVEQAGLADRVEIRLQDYRDVTGTFDRITSVGMFEHVGRDNLAAYFTKMKELLADDGLAMNHGITSCEGEDDNALPRGGDFIDKYVFPAGELPHLAQALHAMQQGGLESLDIESLRRHYMRTLQLWSARFEDHAEKIRSMVGETTYRIWRVYLAGCAHSFAIGNVSVYQILCQKAARNAATLPWSRNYMYPSAS